MNENMITIAIPTRNHPNYIDNILKSYAKDAVGCKILIIDSSTSNVTRCVCEQYKYDLKNVQYVHVDYSMTPDEKVELILELFDTEYLWICGDGLILDKKILDSDIFDANYNIIHLVDSTSRDNRRYYIKKKFDDRFDCNDLLLFAKNFFWTSTYLGSILINKDIANALTKGNVLARYLNSDFMFICGLLDACVGNELKAEVISIEYYTPNPAKKEAVWMQSEAVFKIWAQNMPKAVMLLPKFYDEIKGDIIKYTAVRNNYLTRRGLIRWRAKGILDKITEKKYGEDIVRCSTVTKKELKFISKMPVFCCRIIMLPFQIRNKVKRLLINIIDMRRSLLL